MTLHDWADVSIIIQGVLLPLSILILIWQVWKQSKLTRAANAQSLVEIATPFHLALVQDSAVAELWKQGASQYSEMDPIRQERYMGMITWWIMLHESIHHQWQEDLIDDSVYSSWRRDLEYFLTRHKIIAERWPKLREYYEAAFAVHVDGIIQEQEKKRAERDASSPASQ
ncbi:MAG TPA: hypothetical protein VGG20_18930 [Thermoanaerobaculia bacterium]|jgi:hypothetical protein